MGLMQQEEQEMYLGLLKKTLSGALGKNLVDITFPRRRWRTVTSIACCRPCGRQN